MHLHTRVGLHSILLSLALAAGAWGQATPKASSQAQTVPLRYARPWQVLRTVRSGEPMVLDGFSCDLDTELLLFVPPTLLPS